MGQHSNRRCFFMKKMLLVTSFIVMLIASGCGNNQFGTGNLNNNDDLTEQLSTDPHFKDQNPNLPQHQGMMEDDSSKARNVVENANFESGTVWVNGDEMRVTAYTDKKLSKKERKKQEQHLHNKLTNSLPRYDIKVKIKKR